MSDDAPRGKSRHVSIRVDDDLFRRLDVLAAERDETVSQCARRLLAAGLEPRDRSRRALDDTIATLELIRDRYPDVTAPHTPAGPGAVDTVRTVNILNAKTNLSRLLNDVGRGEHVVITHAGAPRARLVPVDGAAAPRSE